MNDQELDNFLIKTLNNILIEMKACAEYTKDCKGEEYKEINEDYKLIQQELTEILNNITGIDDLSEMDEDTITAVYEYIAEYAGNFVISPEDSAAYTDDMKEYEKLEELLYLFLDSDEDEEFEE